MSNKSHTVYTLQVEIDDLRGKRAAAIAEFDTKIQMLESTLHYFLNKEGATSSQPSMSETVDLNKRKHVVFIGHKKEDAPILKKLVRKVVENDIKQFITTEQLAVLLIANYYPDRNVEEFKPQLSNLLSKWKYGKYGACEITSYQYSTSKKDTVWGRKDWLSESGSPLPGKFELPELVEVL